MRSLAIVAFVALSSLAGCDNKSSSPAKTPQATPAPVQPDAEPGPTAAEAGPTPATPPATTKLEPCAEMSCDATCIDCGKVGFCVPQGGTCAQICESKRKDFEAAKRETACERDDDCTVYVGNCEVGLGGCYAVVSKTGAAKLAAIRDGYAAANCNFTSGACRCAAPPEKARCIDERCEAINP